VRAELGPVAGERARDRLRGCRSASFLRPHLRGTARGRRGLAAGRRRRHPALAGIRFFLLTFKLTKLE
jgi:hypothetical protein